MRAPVVVDSHRAAIQREHPIAAFKGLLRRGFDGTFTYLVATEDGLGYAKDQWSAKPLVTMETVDIIAIASEEIALRGVFAEEIERIEPQKSEVMTWLL